MAVPYYRRSVSKKEYFYNFKKIQKEIISLLLRDFGIRETDDEICIAPAWMIEQKRKEILESLSSISAYISRASAVYPTNEIMKKERIVLQNRAIQECFVLHDNIQFCSEIFPVKNRNVYTQIAYNIQQEVLFLKYWKKSTNKITVG